jgi:hypothetical protein
MKKVLSPLSSHTAARRRRVGFSFKSHTTRAGRHVVGQPPAPRRYDQSHRVKADPPSGTSWPRPSPCDERRRGTASPTSSTPPRSSPPDSLSTSILGLKTKTSASSPNVSSRSSAKPPEQRLRKDERPGRPSTGPASSACETFWSTPTTASNPNCSGRPPPWTSRQSLPNSVAKTDETQGRAGCFTLNRVATQLVPTAGLLTP